MQYRSILIALIAVFSLSLTACESPEPAAPAEPAAEAPEVAAEETTEAPAEAVEVTELAVDESEGITEEAAADEIQLAEVAPAAATQADKTDWKYDEGAHYRRLTASQGTSSPPDKIEVAEIFWYGCPHCYNFDPLLTEWSANQPADVAFVKVPVIWNPTNQVHARIMYTAEALGKSEEIHAALFEGIHQKNEPYTTDESIIELFEEYGVDEAEFREAYNSFGVTSAVKRAENLTRRYGIRSVPVLVVNGKYVTDGEQIKSFGDMLNTADELVARERAER